MSRNDLLFSLSAAFLTAGFLIPTLESTNLYGKLPIPFVLLFLVFPTISIIGMFTASYLGKKFPILWQVAKFGQIGVLNTAVDFGILNFLINVTGVTSGAEIILINAVSFTTALVNSYFWNKSWVFDKAKKSNFLTFIVITLIGLSINTGVVYGLTTYISPIIVTSSTLWANLAKVLATCLSLVWNFAGYKLIVFKTTPSAKESVVQPQ